MPGDGARGHLACARHGRRVPRIGAGLLAGLLCALAAGAVAGGTVIFEGDAVRAPLTAVPGDPARGKAAMVRREQGHCILCHALPEADVPFAGDVGPPLAGVGARLSAAQIRARIVDASRINPDTVMPAYFRTDGLRRVQRAYAGRTVLAAQDVEDVVAYLLTLR